MRWLHHEAHGGWHFGTAGCRDTIQQETKAARLAAKQVSGPVHRDFPGWVGSELRCNGLVHSRYRRQAGRLVRREKRALRKSTSGPVAGARNYARPEDGEFADA